jgi:hypothetical protein
MNLFSKNKRTGLMTDKATQPILRIVLTAVPSPGGLCQSASERSI